MAIAWLTHPVTAADWRGVDETVIEKAATQAGREPAAPLIDTDRGDLLLFVFLSAGAVGGFVAGYCFRGLFGPRNRSACEEASQSHDA